MLGRSEAGQHPPLSPSPSPPASSKLTHRPNAPEVLSSLGYNGTIYINKSLSEQGSARICENTPMAKISEGPQVDT